MTIEKMIAEEHEHAVGSKIHKFTETFDKDSRQKYFRGKHFWTRQYVPVFSEIVAKRKVHRDKCYM